MADQKALADRLFPEIEDDSSMEILNVPPEGRRLHTESADLTVSSLYDYVQAGKIVIPEFQRRYVWSRTQASRLIESLVIQVPIPVIYFSQTSENKLIVVDGNQRLLSIHLFLAGAFELQGLRTYPELNGVFWENLDPRLQDHIRNRTIRCITILRDTHPQIKFDVFERLNTGSVKLNAQELRHGINHGPLMKLLENLNKESLWQRLASLRTDKRMKGEELILRYFALRKKHESYRKPLSAFLDQFSADYRDLSPEVSEEWREDFLHTLRRVNAAFGVVSFRIYGADLKARSPFNAALYDAQMISFAEIHNKALEARDFDAAEFQEAFFRLFSDSKFDLSVRQATSDEAAVATRISVIKQFLKKYK